MTAQHDDNNDDVLVRWSDPHAMRRLLQLQRIEAAARHFCFVLDGPSDPEATMKARDALDDAFDNLNAAKQVARLDEVPAWVSDGTTP